jgi:DNA-binding NarL/FixJ family response regulator
VTVLLACLDSIVTIGLITLLREDARLCLLECGPDDAALDDAIRRWEPQIAILGEKTEPNLVEHLRSICAQTAILVLAHDPTLEQGMRLLAAGANCVARDSPDLDLCAMVQLTARGERLFVAADGERIVRRYPPHAERLTKRERQVLTHVARGASYAAIACALQISYRTVQTYVARIMEKLDVQDRRELVGMPVPWECAAE